MELEEVDLAIEAVPGVTRCRCVYDKEKKRLIAFYEGTADAASLRAHALETLPPFMMPTKILPIEAMPLTKNGKVDRAALLALSREAAPVAAPGRRSGRKTYERYPVDDPRPRIRHAALPVRADGVARSCDAFAGMSAGAGRALPRYQGESLRASYHPALRASVGGVLCRAS